MGEILLFVLVPIALAAVLIYLVKTFDNDSK